MAKLVKIFCGLIAAGSFPIFWKTANITPILKGDTTGKGLCSGEDNGGCLGG